MDRWQNYYGFPLQQKYWDTVTNLYLTFLTEMKFFGRPKLWVVYKKNELACFHSKGQFSFFPNPKEVWWDPLRTQPPLQARIWVELPCCSTMILSGFFILMRKYLIDLNCFSYFGEYLHFLPCLGKQKLTKHLKQILWERWCKTPLISCLEKSVFIL